MNHLIRAVACSLAVGLTLAVAGCAEDNEKTANIKGQAPPEGTYPKTQADMKDQMKGMTRPSLPTSYPGAAKR